MGTTQRSKSRHQRAGFRSLLNDLFSAPFSRQNRFFPTSLGLALLLLSALTLTSCAGGLGEMEGEDQQGGPPRIISTTPYNGEYNVSRFNMTVQIAFSTDMEPSTQEYFALMEGGVKVMGNLHWITPSTLQFIPSMPLNPNGNYIVSLSEGRSLKGEVLVNAPYSWTFTTGF